MKYLLLLALVGCTEEKLVLLVDPKTGCQYVGRVSTGVIDNTYLKPVGCPK